MTIEQEKRIRVQSGLKMRSSCKKITCSAVRVTLCNHQQLFQFRICFNSVSVLCYKLRHFSSTAEHHFGILHRIEEFCNSSSAAPCRIWLHCNEISRLHLHESQADELGILIVSLAQAISCAAGKVANENYVYCQLWKVSFWKAFSRRRETGGHFPATLDGSD